MRAHIHKGRGGGCSLPLITLYKSKARQPLTLLVVWETRCNLRPVPGAACSLREREGRGSVACKSMQTQHSQYITDEDIICELYSQRQQQAEVYGNIRRESDIPNGHLLLPSLLTRVCIIGLSEACKLNWKFITYNNKCSVFQQTLLCSFVFRYGSQMK